MSFRAPGVGVLRRFLYSVLNHAEPPRRRLVSLTDTYRALGVSRTTLYRLVRDGHLPVVEFPGRTLVDSADLDAFIESRKTRRSRKERGPAGKPSLVTSSAPLEPAGHDRT